MYVRNSVLFCFATGKNDRSSQPSGQSGCGSGDGRKRRYVGIYHSSRDVRTFANHFRNLILLYQPELVIIYCFIEFQVSHPPCLVNIDFSLIFFAILLTSCWYIRLKSPLPTLSNPWLRDCERTRQKQRDNKKQRKKEKKNSTGVIGLTTVIFSSCCDMFMSLYATCDSLLTP